MQCPKMIGKTMRQTGLQHRLMQSIQTSALQRPERSHQISTVHGRNKHWGQGLKRPGVVPVEKMPAIAAKCGDRRQRPQGLLGKLRDRQISKLARNLSGIKKKTEVGRRNSCGDGGWLVLDVVRDQPIVFFSAEFSKIAPGAQRSPAQEDLVGLRRFIVCRSRWPI